jgi:hypothetical protein
LEIIVLVLAVGSLAAAARWRKKVVILVVALLWAGGIGVYMHASYGARRAMARAERRTTRAVIEVYGAVGETWGVAQTVSLTSKADLASLFECLKLERNGVWIKMACACKGNPHIQLYDASGRFATITVHGGRMVRCTLWSRCNVDIQAEAVPKLRAFMDSREVVLED